jgi:hypothetical protein
MSGGLCGDRPKPGGEQSRQVVAPVIFPLSLRVAQSASQTAARQTPRFWTVSDANVERVVNGLAAGAFHTDAEGGVGRAGILHRGDQQRGPVTAKLWGPPRNWGQAATAVGGDTSFAG